jgi:uncharacterized protein
MIRVVFDTNIIISGRLWSGAPRQALKLADEGQIKSLISETMIDEFQEVINRPKFIKRLEIIGKSADEIVIEHLKSAEIVEVMSVDPVVKSDPDDNHIIACAMTGNADYVVTGDPHLLSLNNFDRVPIVSVNVFLEQFQS